MGAGSPNGVTPARPWLSGLASRIAYFFHGGARGGQVCLGDAEVYDAARALHPVYDSGYN